MRPTSDARLRRRAVAVAMAIAGILVVAANPATAGAAPGDATVVPLQITGPPADRLNLVVMGDGYTASQMQKFRDDVDRNLNVQWSVEPFRSYRNYFNIYRLEIESQDSGISCDPDDGNIRRNTPLRLNYTNVCPADPLARGITYGPALQSGGGCPTAPTEGLGDPRCSRHAAAQQVPGDLPGPAGRDRAERPDAGAREHVHLRRHRRHAGDDVGRQPAGPADLDARARPLPRAAGGRVPVLVARRDQAVLHAAASPARSTTRSGRASRT